jgi:D-alanyl-D-alanine carboxypeptidase (penicillin-binding protein 5/6)
MAAKWIASGALVATLLAFTACVDGRLLPVRPLPQVSFDSQWPAQGQAAVIMTGWTAPQATPDQSPVPIASIAKVMTAIIVLAQRPLEVGQDGPLLTVTAADVADLAVRRQQDQSVVGVVAGEQLSERQALEALLIASGNNIAMILARWVAGSAPDFIAGMNTTARSLGMRATRYTDPSGFDAATVSTASDQLVLIRHAMRNSVFAAIVGTSSVALPVAGVIHNTDTALGHDGIFAGKTGSDDAAGGCFAFAARRADAGRTVTVIGVVLGQHGPAGLIPQALSAASGLVFRVVAQPAG